MLSCAPNLRWVQSPSSGIGPALERIGVMGSRLIVTNAAGIHAQPLAEFVVMAALYFAKEVPRLNAWKANHHWERFCGYELAGSRMLLVGLGGAGARVAKLSAALGARSKRGAARCAGRRPEPNGHVMQSTVIGLEVGTLPSLQDW